MLSVPSSRPRTQERNGALWTDSQSRGATSHAPPLPPDKPAIDCEPPAEPAVAPTRGSSIGQARTRRMSYRPGAGSRCVLPLPALPNARTSSRRSRNVSPSSALIWHTADTGNRFRSRPSSVFPAAGRRSAADVRCASRVDAGIRARPAPAGTAHGPGAFRARCERVQSGAKWGLFPSVVPTHLCRGLIEWLSVSLRWMATGPAIAQKWMMQGRT